MINIETLDFVIMTTPRSGSHMLASALDSHPDIACVGEIHKQSPMYAWLGNRGGTIKGGIQQMPSPAYVPRDMKVLCLTRDPEKIAESYYSELESGAWHCTDANDKRIVRNGAIDINKFMDRESRLLERVAEMKKVLYVSYEELTQGGKHIDEVPRRPATKICAFLGVDLYPLTPAFRKASDGTIRA